ncbi:hypothetical protein QUF74_11325 [Candidatus Halobeggiatoa sp. HSG11]|nr:hypothetical protein [Candidatus Halobeggiatoa sp. HSG11]
MKKRNPKNPKARNNSAHASLKGYFDRISNSLEDRLSEYVQMKKYVRIYEESMKLLEIEKTINIAAGSIYEINLDKKLDTDSLKNLIRALDEKNKALKRFIKGKPQTLQLKLLSQVYKNIFITINNLMKINKHINRINETIPVVKALLKLQDKEDNFENDPILIGISNALSSSVNEPSLENIKSLLAKENINLLQYDAKLNFEQINDVSDKLIGLLNDKLLLIIGISEFLIAGVEDDGANDIMAEHRIPDELRVLFLASTVLDVIYRIKEIRNSIKNIFGSIKLFLQIVNSERLGTQYQTLLQQDDNSIYELLSNTTPNTLQRIKKSVIEVTPGLDALDLKLKIDTLDLDMIIRIAYGLIYEKANHIWENPYN